MTSAAPIVGGIVYKKGPSGWKERWCIMKSQYFVYYKDAGDTSSPQGYFDVTDSKCNPTVNDGKSKWKFEVEDRAGRTWYLYVENDKARNQWVNAIRKISSNPTQLLPDQQVWEDENSSQSNRKTSTVTSSSDSITNNNTNNPEDNIGSDEDVKSDEDNNKGYFRKLGGKIMGGDDKKQKEKKKGIPQQTGFSARAQRNNTLVQNNTNSSTTGPVSHIPTVCPYQIKELNSPAIRSTTLICSNRIRAEEEEAQRNEVALKKGLETKNKGKEEIDSDEDDLLPEEREQMNSNCKQQ